MILVTQQAVLVQSIMEFCCMIAIGPMLMFILPGDINPNLWITVSLLKLCDVGNKLCYKHSQKSFTATDVGNRGTIKTSEWRIWYDRERDSTAVKFFSLLICVCHYVTFMDVYYPKVGGKGDTLYSRKGDTLDSRFRDYQWYVTIVAKPYMNMNSSEFQRTSLQSSRQRQSVITKNILYVYRHIVPS